MGKIFDLLNNINYSNLVQEYLLSRGFYRTSMNPRFLNGAGYDKLTIGASCMRHDSNINDGYTLRIFINSNDIYYEVENPWESYHFSDRYDPNNYSDVEGIDILLDIIITKEVNINSLQKTEHTDNL